MVRPLACWAAEPVWPPAGERDSPGTRRHPRTNREAAKPCVYSCMAPPQQIVYAHYLTFEVAVFQHESRHNAPRIDREIGVLVLLARRQIDGDKRHGNPLFCTAIGERITSRFLARPRLR